MQKKLGVWMKSYNTKRWSIGCKLVQWRINTQFHQTIKDTPYHLMFGQHPHVGISNLPISQEILSSLATEMDVNQCLGLPLDVPMELAILIASQGTMKVVVVLVVPHL